MIAKIKWILTKLGGKCNNLQELFGCYLKEGGNKITQLESRQDFVERWNFLVFGDVLPDIHWILLKF